MNPLIAPLAGRTDFESQLASYRDLVVPLMMGAVPEPRAPPVPLRYHRHLPLGRRQGVATRPVHRDVPRVRGAHGQTLPSAAALELLHNALLVHDDIEDQSEYRRDKPTLHRQFGVPLAVNAGDALNAMSVRMLRENLRVLGPDLSLRIFDEFDHMTIETIEGQAMELGWIRDNACDTTEDDYLLMVLKKTCWYSFIHPCRIGAIVARPDGVDLDAFNRFGCYLGTAFQIHDDVLNLVGDRAKYGKEIGGDILEGKRTLILAHLLSQASPPDKDRLKTFFAKPRSQRLAREVAWVIATLERYGSIEYGRRAARDFADAAHTEFGVAYGNAAAGADVDFLRRLLDYMVSREV